MSFQGVTARARKFQASNMKLNRRAAPYNVPHPHHKGFLALPILQAFLPQEVMLASIYSAL